MTEEPVETVPVGPAYTLLYSESGSIHLTDLQDQPNRQALFSVNDVVGRSLSPDGDHLALVYVTSDSTHLVLVDVTNGTTQQIHSQHGMPVYSLEWMPDGSELAFGYYSEQNGTMGPGDILVASTDGSTRRVGCRASKTVQRWLPDGTLAVGDGTNFYIVDAETCRTISTVSLRKKHFTTYAPDGKHISYIYRDLVYNREARSYDPDSSLYIADADGSNEKLVIGHKYHARNMVWSPDGSQLLFEVQSQENPALRHIAYYDVASDESTFLVRADENGLPSEWEPVWAPDSDHMVYNRHYPEQGIYQKVVRTLSDLGLEVVGQYASAEAMDLTWGWADPTVLVLVTPEGSYKAIDVSSGTTHELPAGEGLVHLHIR